MTKIIIVGGFLGAGKTTVIMRLAKYFTGMGKRIGVITNDGGRELVDETYFKAHGIDTEKVTGSCFCRQFSDFTKHIADFTEKNDTDIILAEPIGSSANISSDVFRPLLLDKSQHIKNFNDNFTISPLTVVADPKRLRRFINSAEENEINYIFKHQLKESDIILLNKSDLYDISEIDMQKKYLEENFKNAEVLVINKNESSLFASLAEKLTGAAVSIDSLNYNNIDRMLYKKADESFAWFSMRCFIKSNELFDINIAIKEFLLSLQSDLEKASVEIGHIKCIAFSDSTGDIYKASITGTYDAVSTDQIIEPLLSGCGFILNARVKTTCDKIKSIVDNNIRKCFYDFMISDVIM